MIGVPPSTPNTPTLVIVMVPPARSAGAVRPARAVAASPPSAAASSRRLSRSASLIFGTSRPRGVAAAIPRLHVVLLHDLRAAASQDALTSGWRRTAP